MEANAWISQWVVVHRPLEIDHDHTYYFAFPMIRKYRRQGRAWFAIEYLSKNPSRVAMSPSMKKA